MTLQGKQLLRDYESLRRRIYQDAAGKFTIGYGHLLTESEVFSKAVRIGPSYVDYSGSISVNEAEQLLDQDVAIAERAVNALVKVDLNDNQRDALVIFTFNVGIKALERSTLLKELNAGNYDVGHEFRRWNKLRIGGEIRDHPGLTNRREKEVALWERPIQPSDTALA